MKTRDLGLRAQALLNGVVLSRGRSRNGLRVRMQDWVHWEIKGQFRKRVVLSNVPSFRFSFRGNIRMYPRSGFRSGFRPNVPSFRFHARGTSAKTTLLATPDGCEGSCGGGWDAVAQPHSMGGVRGERRDTHTHTYTYTHLHTHTYTHRTHTHTLTQEHTHTQRNVPANVAPPFGDLPFQKRLKNRGKRIEKIEQCPPAMEANTDLTMPCKKPCVGSAKINRRCGHAMRKQ